MNKGRALGMIPIWLLLVVAWFGIFAPAPAVAAPLKTISFQARVVSKDRLTAPTGTFSFRFSLYTASSGGSPVWQEAWGGGNALSLKYGLFSVNLGQLNPLDGLDWADTGYWLGIEFDGDRNGTLEQAFSERLPLSASPFALSASSATTAQTAQSATTAQTAQSATTAQTLSQTLPIELGGTGATNTGTALNNLLPSQAGHSGQALVSDGTTASWQTVTSGVLDASYLTLGSHSGLENERTLQGTANQIILADSGPGGTVTLSLPQSIATSSTPQFARLGLGTAAHATNPLALAESTTASGGILFGADVNLYRSAANTLKTDDNLVAQYITSQSGTITIDTPTNSRRGIYYYDTGLGVSKWWATYDSNTDAMTWFHYNNDGTYDNANMSLTGTGQLQLIRGGSTAGILLGGDANLYRGAANQLFTDDLLAFSTSKTNTAVDFLTYKADGGVGFIFNTNSTYSTGSLMSVRNNGQAKFSISANGNVVISGTLTQSGTPADVAENIAVADSSIEPGDVVTTDSGRSDAAVRKASETDSHVLGVISSEPGILLSGATDGRPLALTGRVPVKVMPESGIAAGDRVVASSRPGWATKAGSEQAPAVGYALENQEGDRVLVQLQPGYYLPSFGTATSSSALSPQQTDILSSLALLDGTLSVDRLAVNNLTVSAALTVNGGLVMPASESAASILPASETAVFVPSARVRAGDRILLTPEYNGQDSIGLSRGAVEPGVGFWVHGTSAPTVDLTFDWLLIH